LRDRRGAAFTDELAHLWGDAGGRRLFHDLLVTALHGAVALAQIEGVALTVSQHLDLDVARVLQVLLHVDHVVVEELARFGFGQGDGGWISAASVRTTRMPRPPPPPAALMITG
jgi:hypothetical protein